MTLTHLVKQGQKLLGDNSPAILTGIAVAGTISSVLLASRGSFRAALLIEEERERRMRMDEPKLETRDLWPLIWREYIPAAASTTTTIAAMVTANRIGTKRATALAAAYSLSEKAFVEYRDKVVERLGENKERQVREAIAQDRINNNPPTGEQVLVEAPLVLCYDMHHGRYFKSTMEDIKAAQNAINYQILHNNYCSLNEFYEKLGLPWNAMDDELGWNSDHLMEIVFSSMLADNNQPVLVMTFHVEPVRRYYKSR